MNRWYRWRKSVIVSFTFFGCVTHKPTYDHSALRSGEESVLECEEVASDKKPGTWKALVKFDATGTAANVVVKNGTKPQEALHTAFDYKSSDSPEPVDTYSFSTTRNGVLTLTNHHSTEEYTAVLRSLNSSILFECFTKDLNEERQFANTLEANPNIQTQKLRCFEEESEDGWELEATVTTEGKVSASEVILQKKGSAPNIRRANFEKYFGEQNSTPLDGSQHQIGFALVVSRNERFKFDMSGTDPTATWTRGSSAIQFRCPAVYAH